MILLLGGQGSSQMTVIHPLCGWNTLNLMDMSKYRELLLAFSACDLYVHCKQFVRGATREVLQLLVAMAIFWCDIRAVDGISVG